jgi:hypothetical protein
MSEVASYELYVDWNNDGDFGDSGEDISADLIEATVQRGYSTALARMPAVTRATFVLTNVSKDYSPPLQSNVLPRRPVKWEMTYGGSTVTLFRGFLDGIEPDFGQRGERRVRLECVDAMALLDLFEGEIALQTSVYADDLIDEIVAAVYTPPSTAYQSGINQFVTSAEGWQHEGIAVEEIKASQKIEEVCTSDWGRFFIAKDGAPTFYNRHQMPLDDSTELTLNSTMLRMIYRKAIPTVYNYVEVTCYPRTVGVTNEVLGRISQQNAPRIEASDSQTFVLRFRDPANAKIKIGGKDCVTPVSGTDFQVTSDPGGGGDNENANITPSATFYGDHAEVTLTNGAAHPVFVQRLQVRGLAVRVREPITVVAQDATSIAAYQKRRLPIKAPLLSDPADALLLAQYLLDYYKDPVNEVNGLEILANKNATWMAAVRDLELMDRVVITETQTGLSGWAGHIMRMTHRYANRYDHRLIFDLEQAYDIEGTPFRIDVSTFDSGHVMIY